MKVRHDVFVVCMSLLISLLLSCKQNKNQWRGRIENKDGLTTIQNPKEVLHPSQSIQFEEDLTIGKDEGPEEYLLNSISIFNVDKNGTIFINDYNPQCIKVFDNNGIYVKTIGRKGQGPGEFQSVDGILFTNNSELIVKDGGRRTLIFFNSKGDFVNEIKRQELLMSGSCAIDSLGVIYFEKPGMFGPSFIIKTCPPYDKFEQIAGLERPTNRVVPPSLLRLTLLPNDHLVWGISTRYELNIVNPDGRLIKKIFKEDVPTPVSEDYKEKYFGVLPPGISRESQNFRKYFPAFDFIFCDEKGRLFVKTFNKLEGSEAYVIDVFDEEGKFIAQTALEIADEISLFQDKCIIRNGKLYTKSYTKNGFPVIKRFNIIWNSPEIN